VFYVFVLLSVLFLPHIYSCLLSFCVQLCRTLPPGGNTIAVNKYRIIYLLRFQSYWPPATSLQIYFSLIRFYAFPSTASLQRPVQQSKCSGDKFRFLYLVSTGRKIIYTLRRESNKSSRRWANYIAVFEIDHGLNSRLDTKKNVKIPSTIKHSLTNLIEVVRSEAHPSTQFFHDTLISGTSDNTTSKALNSFESSGRNSVNRCLYRIYIMKSQGIKKTAFD